MRPVPSSQGRAPLELLAFLLSSSSVAEEARRDLVGNCYLIVGGKYFPTLVASMVALKCSEY